jgi:hypothetical protein
VKTEDAPARRRHRGKKPRHRCPVCKTPCRSGVCDGCHRRRLGYRPCAGCGRKLLVKSQAARARCCSAACFELASGDAARRKERDRYCHTPRPGPPRDGRPAFRWLWPGGQSAPFRAESAGELAAGAALGAVPAGSSLWLVEPCAWPLLALGQDPAGRAGALAEELWGLAAAVCECPLLWGRELSA